MDWDTRSAAIAGIAIGCVVTMLVMKIWKDVVPDRKLFTAPRLYFMVMGCVCLYSIWRLVLISTGEEPFSRALATMFLLTIAAIVITAAAGGFMIWTLLKRVATIEKHVGLAR